MDDIRVYDDLISKEQQDEIESLHTGPYFGWYLANTPGHYTVDPLESGSLKNHNIAVKDNVLLTHDFIIGGQIVSGYFDIIEKLFKNFVKSTNIKIEGFYRIKSNLQLKSSTPNTEFCNTPHVDSWNDHTVVIYYVNDSDGDTRIFDNVNGEYKPIKIIEPKRGRFILFNGKYYHAGAHPDNHDKRIVINFNFT
jgi:hypothetical protein